jgi:hypothetical protein
MKTRIFKTVKTAVLGSLALAASLSGAPLYALPIVNGGFETGDLTGWSVMPAAFDGGVTSADAYAGEYCLEMGPEDFVYQDLAFPDSYGAFRFKAKSATTLSYGVRNATVYSSDGTSRTKDFSGSLSSTSWTDFTLPLDPSKIVVRVEFSVFDATPVYIDRVALTGP